jgi:hypothetical protein
MKISHIFFLFFLLLGVNTQTDNNTNNDTIKVINNINKTNDNISVLQRNDVVQNEQIKKPQKIITMTEKIKVNTNQNDSQIINNDTKRENVKIVYENNIPNNTEQIKNNTEQIKNNQKNSEQIKNNTEKENIKKQEKIINPNQKQNQTQAQQKKEEKKDIKNNNAQKQNNIPPKKEEKEKDKKINNNNNNKDQKNNQQKATDKVKDQKQNQNKNQNQKNSQQKLNNTQSNKTEKDKQDLENKLKEGVINPDSEKIFNLTESLINFFKETFGTLSNVTKEETEEEKKRKQVEEEIKKRLEAEREKKRKEELAKLEKIKMEEKKKKEKEKKAEDGRFEFFKILSNKTFEEIISMHIPKGEKETLYLDIDSFKKIYIAVTTSDLDLNEKFNFFFSGLNARGRTAAIYQVYNKNYIFWEYETLRKGEFIAEITNKGTKDNDLVFFFGKYEEKKKDRIDTEKIDKISMLLNDIDSNINQIRNKKSIEIKQANTHNEKVTKNNTWIVIYSVIEIFTMSLVFLIQSCYINSLVKAV